MGITDRIAAILSSGLYVSLVTHLLKLCIEPIEYTTLSI